MTARPPHRSRSGRSSERPSDGPKPSGSAHVESRSPAEPRARPESRSRSRSRRGGGGAPSSPQLTSLPTGRRAYNETRQWLLDRHGPVCAYCGLRGEVEAITLDHVTPRRGQTAYDRRDNLVLACQRCNGNKADTSILAFLIARRERAATLLRYGGHLSPMLLDLAKQIAGDEAAARAARLADPDYPYAD